LPSAAEVVIVLEGASVRWTEALDRVRSSGREAWAEVTSRGSALLAVEAGASGLIVSGQEAGGWISADSSFILLQAVVNRVGIPVWVRGGIGPHIASGVLAAGAAGVVLDGALLLARESSLGEAWRERLARWDGTETTVLGPAGGSRLRVAVPPGSPALLALREAAAGNLEDWRAATRQWVGSAPGQAWPVGQDSAFAAPLAAKYTTVGGIIQAVEASIHQGWEAAKGERPLSEGSAMARSLGTRYPIIQGPMTRVSDVVEFAEAVAEGGALPLLALALLGGSESSRLIEKAKATLEGKSWGVGILGFAPPEIREPQVSAILASKPPFALIAGGRPDQAAELEAAGIATFLHVPSPGLLDQFLRDGARRFVLEGRECGGHVGPRSSFVLWEQAVTKLLEAIKQGTSAESLHVVFAGGIHDGRSAALVSAMAAPLATQGVKIGVLVGTAYLFTQEAVTTRAIVDRYQREALRCAQTVLLETSPGHEVRVAPSPFVDRFETERRRLVAERVPHDEARESLERLNAGRLRVAAKGVDRSEGAGSPMVAVEEPDQYERGVYMLGQVATLRDEVTTIEALHRSIAEGLPSAELEETSIPSNASQPSDVAIVGMSAILPGAGDVRTWWENTLKGVDAITEIPADRWDWRTYYDADPKAPDKVISKWGGFVPDIPFDPLRYGMPPSSLPSIEPVQLLLLEATRAAIDDAGYADRPFARERTAVVLGMGGGAAQLAMGYAFRSYLPMLDAVTPGAGSEALRACAGLLPEWTEDSFPGFLLNVAAGRVANRFDLGGANYTVDAACGSSLAAASLAVRELETGSADVVILGGADTVQNPFTYLAFSKTQAFSPRGRCRPFDASADGIVISEGVAVVVLKRLADAERDGDRIYAVIKGLGASSDGRAKGLTAPSPEGQVRAVERAYAKAGINPSTVGYVEAHGTGTAVGDVVEVNSVARVFRQARAATGSVAIGSVKSMIGHTKCAAGLAGLINASLALHHRIKPPTIGVEQVNPKADLSDGPFHVSTQARPWIHSARDRPRRAGVSAFGFGGTNFHAVLEAYEAEFEPSPAPTRDWPAELLAWRTTDRDAMASALDRLIDPLAAGARPALRDLARTINAANPPLARPGPVLAIVATTIDDLLAKLHSARVALRDGKARHDEPAGVFYEESPRFHGQGVAFLFPGQGSQSPGMLLDLAMTFREVGGAFDEVDAALVAEGRPPVGPLVFPTPGREDDVRDRAALRSTDAAQPALGAASLGLLRLLAALGVEPSAVAGHSFGELVALHAAGCLSAEGLATLAHERGRLMLGSLGDEPGAMAALATNIVQAARLIEGLEGVLAVNENGPRQTVIAGPSQGVRVAMERAHAAGLSAQALPVAGAFHTPLVASASDGLAAAALARLTAGPDRPVYSNLDARPHPADPAAIATRLGEHLAHPVKFATMVEAMHRDGSRVFVEVGPGSVLTSLVGSILEDRPHLAVACDSARNPGLRTLLLALARLVSAGVPAQLGRLTLGRSGRSLDLARLPVGSGLTTPSPMTWLVNGTRSRPIAQAEPRRLGQAPSFLHPDRSSKPEPAPKSSPAPSVETPYRNGSTNGHHHNGHTTNGKAMIPPVPPTTPRTPPVLPAASASGAADDRVLAGFQETMRAFLDVQRSTMLAYLASRQASSPSQVSPAPPLPSSARIAPQAFDRPAVDPKPTPPVEPALRAQEPAKSVEAPRVELAESTAPRLDREGVAATLVEIVRDRTGYPSEMLGLDLDLEADLGIDSIKRVEILGTLRDAVPSLGRGTDSATMDALSRARTLGAIVDKVLEVGRKAEAAKAPVVRPTEPAPASIIRPIAPRPEAEPAAPEAHTVRRMVIELVDAPLTDDRAGLRPGGVVIVTDDGRGVARGLAVELESTGHPVILAGTGEVDFSSPSAVEGLLDLARSSGEVAGIVHALPLRDLPAANLDRQVWASRMGSEVKGLFLLAKAAAEDLERASRSGGGAIIAATAMGGSLASGDDGLDFFPGHGGIAGLVKTLAREWEGIRARVVDFDPREPVGAISRRLAAEVRADDGWSEVGYQAGRRIRLQGVFSPLDRSTASRLELASGEPIVLTGGARGITATMAAELASRWKPTLLLLGRNPLPDQVEDRGTAGVVDSHELKAVLLARFRKEGRSVSPSDLERAFQSIRQGREIRANLEAFRMAGATVDYAPIDVRDASALARVLDGWRSRFGAPVGLIHGAGVIKDKLIRDKTAESFDQVLGTKLDGALNLARLLDPVPIRFAALFSSIAGRYGNVGQADYAAANETLNKLAIWLDRRWKGRVVSMIWGPWSGVGMVSELEAHLGGQGLRMISPEVGRSVLSEELRFGAKGTVEVITAGDLGTLPDPIRPALQEASR
jgi:acyl transferase domain-containing protein/NAD(P)H-dependent flavin oxidoreductase YrpB (nitropropane dioxygenase family)